MLDDLIIETKYPNIEGLDLSKQDMEDIDYIEKNVKQIRFATDSNGILKFRMIDLWSEKIIQKGKKPYRIGKIIYYSFHTNKIHIKSCGIIKGYTSEKLNKAYEGIINRF